MTIPIYDLKPGDYVMLAKATVAAVDRFASVAIIEFTDGTATAPLASNTPVEIMRLPLGKQSSAVVGVSQP